jgi:hypothetical protein
MKIEIDLPEYSTEKGIQMSWENEFTIEVQADTKTVRVKANKAGLISLAKQLLTLAQSSIPAGYHMHYDESNSLEDGSCELILEKI